MSYARFINWAFARFYHEAAWTYDTVAWLVSRGYWRAWIEALLPEVREQAVLELGCGTGYLQAARRADGALTVGLDESLPMLRLTRRKASTALVLRAVAQHLPFADQSWSLVVVTFPAPYIFDPLTLREVRRVLRPDGRLLLLDGAVLPAGWHRLLIDSIYRVVLGAASRQQATITHADPRSRWLQQAGFRVTCRELQVRDSLVQLWIAQVA